MLLSLAPHKQLTAGRQTKGAVSFSQTLPYVSRGRPFGHNAPKNGSHHSLAANHTVAINVSMICVFISRDVLTQE